MRNEGKELSPDLAAEYASLLERSMDLLARMRKLTYESMNQFQHEHYCLRMADLLRKQVPGGASLKWHWHPAQTSHPREADVVAYDGEEPVVQAEVTTAARPIGSIDKTMSKTLKKLSEELPGRYKFYGVVSEAMRKRAVTKAAPLNIDVVEWTESGPAVFPATRGATRSEKAGSAEG